MTDTRQDTVMVRGRWSDPVPVLRPTPDPGSFAGVYDTQVGYGGGRYDENHQLWIHADGTSVLGVPVVQPRWQHRTLSFGDQPDATRGGKPSAASITFDNDTFSGWCQFPGEGPIDWYGRRVAAGPPSGTWQTDIGIGGNWYPEDHVLMIAAGRIEVAGMPIVEPVLTLDGLCFSGQPQASRGGMPAGGEIRFADGGFSGWCQFPGEGTVDWRSRPMPPHPRHGVYVTSVSYGGRWWDEDHPVEISPAGIFVAGVRVQNPLVDVETISFEGQPDASRDRKPAAGFLRFQDGRCEGWCQFPGEGRIDWQGSIR